MLQHVLNEVENDQIVSPEKGDPLLHRKDKGKVEKENRRIGKPGKDDLNPKDGSLGIATIDHDEFAHIPRNE